MKGFSDASTAVSSVPLHSTKPATVNWFQHYPLFLLFNKKKYFLWAVFLRMKHRDKEQGDGQAAVSAVAMLNCTTQSSSAGLQIRGYLKLNFKVIFSKRWSLTEKSHHFCCQQAQFSEEIKGIWISEELLLLCEVILFPLYYFVRKITRFFFFFRGLFHITSCLQSPSSLEVHYKDLLKSLFNI